MSKSPVSGLNKDRSTPSNRVDLQHIKEKVAEQVNRSDSNELVKKVTLLVVHKEHQHVSVSDILEVNTIVDVSGEMSQQECIERTLAEVPEVAEIQTR